MEDMKGKYYFHCYSVPEEQLRAAVLLTHCRIRATTLFPVAIHNGCTHHLSTASDFCSILVYQQLYCFIFFDEYMQFGRTLQSQHQLVHENLVLRQQDN